MIRLKIRAPLAVVDGSRVRATFVTVGRHGERYDLGGETVELFRIGTLAEAFDRDARTLKGWEQVGLLPRPLFRIDESTHRRYSATQILNAHRLVRARWGGRRKIRRPEMKPLFEALRFVWFEPRLVVQENGALDTDALVVRTPG